MDQEKATKFSTKMMAGAFIGVTVIFVIIYLTYQLDKKFEDAIISQTQHELLTIAKTAAVSLEEYVYKHLNDLQLLSEYRLLREQKDEYPFLKVFAETQKADYDSVYLLDSNGIVLYRNPFKKGKVGENYADRPDVIHALKEHKPYVSELFYSKSGIATISLSQPIFNEGVFSGIVRCLINLETISKRFIQSIRPGKKGYGQLFDNDG